MDPREVKIASEKIKYLSDMEVYEYSTEAEARARTGRNQLASSGSIRTKEMLKPHDTVRVWCVRRYAVKGFEPIFSATPPLETLLILLSVASQEDVFRAKNPVLISIADVSRAHFYANAVRDVHTRLPNEDPKAKQPGVSWETAKDNVQIFGRSSTMEVTGGFSRGVASPCHFSTRTWRRTFWCTVMTSSLWANRRCEGMH